MKDWKSQFTDVILERGKKYYDQGAVKSLVHSSLGYAASVQGTELYDVEIRMEAHEVVDMYCTCPYAENGFACKHMVATLYAIENEGSLIQCNELVDCLTEIQLNEFLKQILKEHVNLREDLLKMYDLDTYKKNLYLLAQPQGARLSSDSIKSISDSLKVYSDRLFSGSRFYEAFDMALYVCDCLNRLDKEKIIKKTYKLFTQCFQIWQRAYELADSSQKRDIYCHASQTREKSENSIYISWLDEFLMYVCKDQTLLKMELEKVDRVLENSQNISEPYKRYALYSMHPVILRLTIMDLLDYPLEEIHNFQGKYSYIPRVKNWKVKKKNPYKDLEKTYKKCKDLINRMEHK